MTPRYHAIIDYWKNDSGRLEMEHLVWDPTPWVIDIRSPYPGSSPASFKVGDVDRMTHMQWLHMNIGADSWPIHGNPGDWYFAGATVDGETWLGFRTEDMMRRFISAFPQSIIERSTTNPKADPDAVVGGSASSELLDAGHVCAVCGKPATCIGAYEGSTVEECACDDCCGHGNEDGHCRPMETKL